LWHQLSLALEAFLSDDRNARGDNFFQLYEGFIASFEARLNQVKFAGLVSLIVRTLSAQNAIDFVTKILSARTRLGIEAALCLDMDVVTLKLKVGDVEAAKELLEAAKEQVAGINSAESVVFSKYYNAMAEYRKVSSSLQTSDEDHRYCKSLTRYQYLLSYFVRFPQSLFLCVIRFVQIVGPANEFYSAALMFLSYTSVEALRPEERYTLATDMALASVTGDDIYNFGEVLATPILSALKGTANEWLLSLVEAMNSGNVEQFNHAVETHKAQYFAQPALAAKHDSVVKQKIVLLCLVNIAFERHSHDRVINFADIAQRAHIPFDQVEFHLHVHGRDSLCLRCFSGQT
jgi:26S proteasome regulatory subunit N9